jgi:hypothetical protein
MVASAIFLRPDIRGLCSIGMQRKLPWLRTSDDEHSVCRSTGVLSATGVDGHAACRMVWTPPVSKVDRTHLMLRRHIACQWSRRGAFNAEAAHHLPVCQAAPLTRNKCAWPRGLTSGSARWLTSQAAGHVAASSLRLSGEQRRTQYGPNTCWLRTPAWP